MLSLLQTNSLRIAFLNVGQGDSIVIILPDRESAIVIDTPITIRERQITQDFILSNNIKSIELAMITHSDADHSGVADLVTSISDTLDIKRFAFIPDRQKTVNIGPQYKTLLKTIESFRDLGVDMWIPAYQIGTDNGQLTFGDFKLDIIYPDGYSLCGAMLTDKHINNRSTVISINYFDTKIILGSDAEGYSWTQIIKNGIDIKCNILKVPHHGSWLEGFVDAKYDYNEIITQWCPDYAIFSLGSDNTYDHPSDKVINKLINVNPNINILCTQATSKCTNETVDCNCSGTIIFEVSPDGIVHVNTDNLNRKRQFKHPLCNILRPIQNPLEDLNEYADKELE